MFLLFKFSSIFPGGELTPFAPMCGRQTPMLLLVKTQMTNAYVEKKKKEKTHHTLMLTITKKTK